MRYLIPLLLAVPLLAGCVGPDPSVVAVLSAGESPGSALDVAAFEERIAEVCDGCKVEVHDAGGDAEEQRRQFEAVLEEGVGGIVVEAVETDVAEEFTLLAEEVPLVSVGQLVPGSDWFVGLPEPVPTSDVEPDLPAARALVAGDIDSYVHVPSLAISSDAATVVVHAMTRTDLEGSVEYEGVPSWLHEPVEVTRTNLTTVLVADGLVSLDEVCEGQARACRRLGLV
jgi:ABC-type xylose transport system substrate-binding protein